MPRLVLGPTLRFVGPTEATVWVETDRPCTVDVRGAGAPTFEVAGHHYALVFVRGLEPGCRYEYSVRLDGEVAWPDPRSPFPPSAIRTPAPGRPARIVFGSCRVAYPHEPPYTLERDAHDAGRGGDALTAFAAHLAARPADELPDLVLHLGDQVYADELSLGVRSFVHGRRRTVPGPAHEVVDYEEYTRLYHESWGEPTLRWLLSTVPNAMIFDDHDVHDDWNTSLAWRRGMDRRWWWHQRVLAALMSYWVYQHAGNLSPDELEEEGLLADLQRCPGDGAGLLREFAKGAHLRSVEQRWSFRRDVGGARLLIVDSRAGRVLDPARRDMLDPRQWAWLDRNLSDPAEHVVVASSLPVFLPPALHDLEAWNERVCAGAWGRAAIPVGEHVRQYLDLEHWAAFERGFEHMLELLAGVAAGDRGWRPSTVSCLGGDVHFGYVSRIEHTDGRERAPLHQLVCSPFRNHLVGLTRRELELSLSPAGRGVARLLARSAGAARPPARWGITHGPWFENHLGDLRLDGRRATLAIREAVPGHHPDLRTHLLVHLERAEGTHEHTTGAHKSTAVEL